MAKNLIDTINDVDKLTKSQEDRLNLSTRIEENLFTFLDAHLQKASSIDSPFKFLWEATKERIETEGLDNVPWAVLVKLLEIAAKTENEAAMPLLTMIKDIQVSNNTNNTGNHNNESNGEIVNNKDGMTKEEMDRYKTFEKFMNSTKKSEYPEGEE